MLLSFESIAVHDFLNISNLPRESYFEKCKNITNASVFKLLENSISSSTIFAALIFETGGNLIESPSRIFVNLTIMPHLQEITLQGNQGFIQV